MKDVCDNKILNEEIVIDILSYGSNKSNKYENKEIRLHAIKSI